MKNRISSDHKNALNLASDIIKTGGIVVYPTDTLYGFGGIASDSKIVKTINKVKNRNSPMSVIVSDLDMAFEVSVLSSKQRDILSKKLYGAITIIVPAKKGLFCSELLSDDFCVGIRIPDHSFGKNLVRLLNFPITTTSVNRTGETPLNNPDEIMNQFGGQIDLFIDEGTLPPSKGSKIYKLIGNSLSSIR
jgi:L-threonylcarbamoyladenylate synthase